jgi:uncharacterized protein YndB with AHSA1/START domain
LVTAPSIPLSAQAPVTNATIMQVTKPSDREIVLSRSFSASRQMVFDALTQKSHLARWMTPTNFSLVSVDVDLRVGGSFRHVYQRASGKRIEVRGVYKTVDPPNRFEYVETYDFSPLQLNVTTTLHHAGSDTVFTQKIVYASKQERDGDFDSVSTSAPDVYERLARYLESLR